MNGYHIGNSCNSNKRQLLPKLPSLWRAHLYRFCSSYWSPTPWSLGGPELVAMVMADTETRNDNSDVQRILLDSMSTIHIVTSKRGMTDLQPCNKAVDFANKGRSYVKEVVIWKFHMAGKSRQVAHRQHGRYSYTGGFHALSHQ
jgi:hypothetical protein